MHIITESYPDSDGCTALWVWLIPPNCVIKNGCMVNFMLYIFYNNFFNVKNKILYLEDSLEHVCP